MITLNYIEVTQPIGTFYITAMKASEIAQIAEIQPRSSNPRAVQRDESLKRIKEIASYCSDVDATFPTPIIISIYNGSNVTINNNTIIIPNNEKIGEIIDGQHRIRGIVESNMIERFELPVIFMFDLTDEEKAYVFSIINSKQTQVSMSLIYDLFALSENRSPFKTCHEIARGMNADSSSPFYNRLKMLGKKESHQNFASLSQGTFIKYLMELISKNPEDDTRKIKSEIPIIDNKSLVLRDYFIKGKDTIIYKIILNLFIGVSTAFNEEWNNPDKYILSKSIGFGAIIKAFPEIYRKGDSLGDLSKDYFIKVFANLKTYLDEIGVEITSEYFGSNEQARTRLANIIVESLNKRSLFNNN